jgi:hypothetical protein
MSMGGGNAYANIPSQLTDSASFSSWCVERQISPTSTSVGNVADFIVYLHSVKKCKVATIIGYRSTISSKHKGRGGRSVSNNGDLSKLINGIFNSNPILKPLLPNWDLPSVLWRLCDPPFEPLLSCDVNFLTWKTVFLIALATASRVSELHALSVKDGNLRYERHGIILLPNLQFLSKTQRLNNPWIPIFIPLETIHLVTKFFETGLQTPFWYVINKLSESISFL